MSEIPPEWKRVAVDYGADPEQVRRDHLISHVLAALSKWLATDSVVFFGGTALSRTYLPNGRLSEDIDLIALEPRRAVADAVENAVRRGLARSHGWPTWRPPLSSTVGSQPAVLSIADGPSIQVQLLEGTGYTWPTEVVDLEQRYADASPARMRTLTAPAFAAAKLSAWIDRRTPRDLYDLWALAEQGLVDAQAMAVFRAHGPFAQPPGSWVFDRGPDEVAWRSALSHQTRLKITAAEALRVVRESWGRLAR